MKNEILQFIKKIKFCRRLARFNVLFTCKEFSTFRIPAALTAATAHSSTTSAPAALGAYLQSEPNPLIRAFFEEMIMEDSTDFLYRSPQVFNGTLPVLSTRQIADTAFLQRTAADLVAKDRPLWSDRLKAFKSRVGKLTDLRFYASELERLQDSAAGFAELLPYSIEWLQTGKDNLWVSFAHECCYGADLPPPVQCNLLRFWSFLFFEKNLLVSAFPAVLYNSQHQVNFLEIGNLFPVEIDSRRFLTECLHKKAPVLEESQRRIALALQRLRLLTPDIDFNAFMASMAALYPSQPVAETGGDSPLLDLYAKHGLLLSPRSSLVDPAPQKLSYLLDKNRFKKDARFKKSSLSYALPLAILIYVLYRYF